jgi:hypothetical protein
MHEVTLEHHRVGAIKGQILDADGSTVLYNLFTEFGVEQQALHIALSNAAANVRQKAVAIQRLIENELGGEPVTGYRAFCGDDFFDGLLEHAKVKGALKYQESEVAARRPPQGVRVRRHHLGELPRLRAQPGRRLSVDFFDTDEARTSSP